MSKEIEYKFLVKNTDWIKEKISHSVDIVQGYLQKSESVTVRVRVVNDNKALLTIKGPRINIECDEFEYSIPVDDGKHLLSMCSASLIYKTRYYVEDAYYQGWHIDVFKDLNEGLTIAELEVESNNTVPILSDWIGTNVSQDLRYVNTYLSTNKMVS